ncbi:MBL fold metallo-hydrolase [Sulfuracidifex tepidarius]|uniref:Ribonuclease Z n=1 Tax=Sulfuracidifex tepidarius TaxID=1294262 RepID=A0A510DRJ9_9CREN|nr:MBL fold metallo-hydrolase [Sulfuracidifex tepidarius]BBG22784.1 Ribonuclease Z [Sulfuracidifex tepidarius]BBG25563.1 Ribonuclease Z [Sulfuracidifex tepidarius]
MRVLFLGTGSGSSRDSRRFKAGVHVSNGYDSVFLDMGPGSNLRVEDFHVHGDHVFFTHLHIDHFDGVFDYMVSRKVQGLKDLYVHSPPGFGHVLSSFREVGNQVSANVEELDLPRAKVGELEVYSVEACHAIYAVSYVITDGRKKIVYTGDTAEPCEDVVKEIRDANLVIHEASCVDNCKQFGHTSAKEIMSMFSDIKAKMILTHIPAHSEKEIYEAIGNKFLIARDGTIFEL